MVSLLSMVRKSSVSGLLVAATVVLSQPALAAPTTQDADALVKELEADTANKTALAGPLDKARAALGRARSMDQVGDATHAAQMRAVALEWLGLGKDVVRTAQSEARAVEKDKALDDLETKIVRGRALLEETVARRARAQALLEEVDRAAPTTTTAAVADKPSKGTPAKAQVPGKVPPPTGAPPGAGAVPPPTMVPLPQSSPASTPPARVPPGASAPSRQTPPGAPAR